MPAAAERSARNHAETTDIDCSERAKLTMLAVNERIGGRFDAFSGRLSMVLRDLRALRDRGANEAELRLVETTVANLIDDLFHPLAPDYERVARRLESDHDRAEDGVQDLLGIEGESAQLLDEHAKRLDQQAASSRTLARVFRAKARRLRQERETARQRLGAS